MKLDPYTKVRVCASDTVIASGVAAMVVHFKWKFYTVVRDDSEYGACRTPYEIM